MSQREIFLASMAFEPDAPVLKMEYGYWAGAIRRWYKEGLNVENPIPESLAHGDSVRAEVMGFKPGGFVDRDVHKLFEMDNWLRRVPVNNFIHPLLETEILEDQDEWRLYRDGWGILRKESSDLSTPTALLSGPVTSIRDWMEIKEKHLQSDISGRLPVNWEALCTEYKARDYPLILGGGHGFYGTPRYLIGDEAILTTFYDDPKLIHAINDHLCDMWIEIYDKILLDTTVDLALIWEDMCFKNGPLISPAMFKEFLLPYYKRLSGFFRDHGIEIILVDTDGDARKLITLFIEGGVTGMFPVEVAAGMDVSQLREAFPKFQFIGGVDKMKLAQNHEAIDAELDRIASTLTKGGFIPTVDHLVPPDVSWSNFSYYRRKLNDMIDDVNAGRMS
jgi:uroporphyrinogen-III decarboxylase